MFIYLFIFKNISLFAYPFICLNVFIDLFIYQHIPSDCGDINAWNPDGFCCKHGRALSDPLDKVAPNMRRVGTALLTAVREEVALFCEERKRCFDIDLVDQIDANTLHSSNAGDIEDELGDRGGSTTRGVTRPLNYLYAMSNSMLLNARVNFDSVTSNSTSRERDRARDSRRSLLEEDDAEVEAEVGIGEVEEEAEDDHLLCLHDDDINPSEKTLNALSAVGILMNEAVRIRRESAVNGTCTFQPSFDKSFLPSSVTLKDSHTTYKLTDKMKRNLSLKMKKILILKNTSDALRNAGLKISIVSRLMIVREIRMRNILSWLIDFSQINDGMVSMIEG